ncbi:hypothetical protein FHX79_111598 [Streptomyces cavourensis]|uniref:DUF6414 family protein n=1 Tax=Streptomyces cavourensis TaxID=67258 RepID=UPI001154A27C|nr:hypothetical protein [Streptomyces cavourensis]TQO29786.1 hypothetical protein FHX79_111598 [Streptomyces cavourensis]GGU59030.1 hypothetical protein GCM10010498_15330 [Streptomyces cavourensis]
MILREFLYVDTDKVRAMLAQLDGGIAEESRETERKEKRTTLGPRVAGQYFQGAGSETYTNKSLGDALFPMLEEALESESLLRDVSDEVSNPQQWSSGDLKRGLTPGSLVRITALGSLFDTRYAASAFSAFGSVVMGLNDLGYMPTVKPAIQSKPKQGQHGRTPKQKPTDGPAALEDSIPDFPDIGGADGKTLRAFVRVSKGVFAPGLHVNLTPVEGVLINSRLQEGRQYLDSESDILFARYGTERQEWTVVGSIGSYGTEETSLPSMEFHNADGTVNRAKFADSMNAQMRNLGRLGFIDLPQQPGFSLIPFAVYRSIPRSDAAAVTRRRE